MTISHAAGSGGSSQFQALPGNTGVAVVAILPQALLISGLLSFAGAGQAFAQAQITPGAPSLPLSPAAAANGVQDRITRQYGIEFVTIGAPGNAP